MTVAADTVAEFHAMVGDPRYVESPPHSNCTPIIREFGYPVCAAWCAMCLSCVWRRRFGRWILQTASVGQARADAQAGKNGMRWHDRNYADIKAGWGVLYDFGGRGNWSDFHIAQIHDPGDQANFTTDAGNENDRVTFQGRNRKYVIGFIEPPYDGVASGAPSPVSEEDDDMASTDTCELRYGPGEQCTIDLEDLKTGATGWKHAIVNVPWDFVGDVREHEVRIVVIDHAGKVGRAGKLPEIVKLQATQTLKIPVDPEWATLSITSHAPKRDQRGDTNVRTVFWR